MVSSAGGYCDSEEKFPIRKAAAVSTTPVPATSRAAKSSEIFWWSVISGRAKVAKSARVSFGTVWTAWSKFPRNLRVRLSRKTPEALAGKEEAGEPRETQEGRCEGQ
jgi:hypothetical protein